MEQLIEMENKKKVLTILSGGGFISRTLRIVDLLGKDYSYFYVVPEYYKNYMKNKIRIPGKIIPVPKAVIYLAEDKANLLRFLLKIIISFYKSFFVIRNTQPDVIISPGCASGIPFCFWGRVLKRKVIFFESAVRLTKGSLTGKLTYRLRLADRFYIQWPELRKDFPKAIYKGRIL